VRWRPPKDSCNCSKPTGESPSTRGGSLHRMASSLDVQPSSLGCGSKLGGSSHRRSGLSQFIKSYPTLIESFSNLRRSPRSLRRRGRSRPSDHGRTPALPDQRRLPAPPANQQPLAQHYRSAGVRKHNRTPRFHFRNPRLQRPKPICCPRPKSLALHKYEGHRDFHTQSIVNGQQICQDLPSRTSDGTTSNPRRHSLRLDIATRIDLTDCE